MSEKTFTEMVEQNMRDITRMKQEAYQKGFTEGEKRAIAEFLEDLLEQPSVYKKTYEKWERRAKQ